MSRPVMVLDAEAARSAIEALEYYISHQTTARLTPQRVRLEQAIEFLQAAQGGVLVCENLIPVEQSMLRQLVDRINKMKSEKTKNDDSGGS